ncbi:MAG: hypothetical protein PHF56_23455 [Desulfuromonadaceae bacterium]|nr:hypothetical protein [Desulfuromonadaceae bacterium]
MTSDDDSTLLQISPEVRKLLEERGIREEDLRTVISFAENGRQFHTHDAAGHRLAYFTPSKVTYWVEYQPEGEGFRIHNAYSHRMKIHQGFNMPSKKTAAETGWRCAVCELPLELAIVKLAYMDETFAVDLPACPACQRVLVSEEQAVTKMALAERMLEDK